MTKVVQTPFRDRTMSTGITVRVYPVPETLLWRILPSGEPEPLVPMHEMETKMGKQQRLAKEGDPEWVPYLRAHEQWAQRQTNLENDARIVLALRGSKDQPEFDWPGPEEIGPPDYLKPLYDSGELSWPTSPTMQRASWFRATTALSAQDVSSIVDDVSVLSGMEESLVASFREKLQSELRDRLLGESAIPEDTL